MPRRDKRGNSFTSRRAKQALCLVLSFVYFHSSALTPYAAEADFWAERRRAAQNLKDKPTLADTLPGLSDLDPAAGSRKGLTQEQHQLLAQLPRATNFDFGASEEVSITNGLAMATKRSSTLAKPAAAGKADSPTWLSSLITPYGAIRDIHLAKRTDAPLIIHIQDAHEIEEAQRNMGAMIQGLRQERGITLVGLEGAQGAFALEPYRAYGNTAVTRDIAEVLLKDGYIGGPEFVGVTAPEPPLLWGIEDLSEYESNIAAFRDSLKFKPAAHGFLTGLERVAGELKAAAYSEALREFDRQFNAYKKRGVGLGAYVRYLMTAYPDSELGYLNLHLLLDALHWEESLDFKEVEKERLALVETFAKELDDAALSELVQQSLLYRLGRMTYGDYHRYLKRLCAQNGISLSKSRHLSSYINYVLLAEQINRNELLVELARLEEAAQKHLAKTPEQRRLVAVNRHLMILEKLTGHRMTPADWLYYYQNRPSVLGLAAEVRDVAASLGRPADVDEPADLQAVLKPFEAFCEYAIQRNKSLVENLLAKMKDQGATRAVLVAGGFHSDGLTQILREREVSYVVVTPKIDAVPDGHHSLDVFARDPLPLEKVFSGETIYVVAPRVLAAVPSLSGEKTAVVIRRFFVVLQKLLADQDPQGFPDGFEFKSKAVEGYLKALDVFITGGDAGPAELNAAAIPSDKLPAEAVKEHALQLLVNQGLLSEGEMREALKRFGLRQGLEADPQDRSVAMVEEVGDQVVVVTQRRSEAMKTLSRFADWLESAGLETIGASLAHMSVRTTGAAAASSQRPPAAGAAGSDEGDFEAGYESMMAGASLGESGGRRTLVIDGRGYSPADGGQGNEIFVHPDFPEALVRVPRQARPLGTIKDRFKEMKRRGLNVPRVFGSGTFPGGTPYLVVEKVRKAEGASGAADLELVKELLESLVAKRVLVGDFKPENIVFGTTAADPVRRAYLVDVDDAVVFEETAPADEVVSGYAKAITGLPYWSRASKDALLAVLSGRRPADGPLWDAGKQEKGLSPELVKLLASRGDVETLEKAGDWLIKEMAEGETVRDPDLYIVLDGELSVTSSSFEGEVKLGEREIVGELAMLTGRRTANVRAASDGVRLIKLSKQQFTRLLNEDQDLFFFFSGRVLQRLSELGYSEKEIAGFWGELGAGEAKKSEATDAGAAIAQRWELIRARIEQRPELKRHLPALRELYRLLRRLHEAAGLVGTGYHRFEHSLEVALLAFQAALNRHDAVDAMDLLDAGLLHDTDLSRKGPTEQPKVMNTLYTLIGDAALEFFPGAGGEMARLANGEIVAALKALGYSDAGIRRLALLIYNTDFVTPKNPKGATEAQKKEKIDASPDPVLLSKLAALLALSDKAASYVMLSPAEAEDRVRGLARELGFPEDAVVFGSYWFFQQFLEKDVAALIASQPEDVRQVYADNWKNVKEHFLDFARTRMAGQLAKHAEAAAAGETTEAVVDLGMMWASEATLREFSLAVLDIASSLGLTADVEPKMEKRIMKDGSEITLPMRHVVVAVQPRAPPSELLDGRPAGSGVRLSARELERIRRSDEAELASALPLMRDALDQFRAWKMAMAQKHKLFAGGHLRAGDLVHGTSLARLRKIFEDKELPAGVNEEYGRGVYAEEVLDANFEDGRLAALEGYAKKSAGRPGSPSIPVLLRFTGVEKDGDAQAPFATIVRGPDGGESIPIGSIEFYDPLLDAWLPAEWAGARLGWLEALELPAVEGPIEVAPAVPGALTTPEVRAAAEAWLAGRGWRLKGISRDVFIGFYAAVTEVWQTFAPWRFFRAHTERTFGQAMGIGFIWVVMIAVPFLAYGAVPGMDFLGRLTVAILALPLIVPANIISHFVFNIGAALLRRTPSRGPAADGAASALWTAINRHLMETTLGQDRLRLIVGRGPGGFTVRSGASETPGAGEHAVEVALRGLRIADISIGDTSGLSGDLKRALQGLDGILNPRAPPEAVEEVRAYAEAWAAEPDGAAAVELEKRLIERYLGSEEARAGIRRAVAEAGIGSSFAQALRYAVVANGRFYAGAVITVQPTDDQASDRIHIFSDPRTGAYRAVVQDQWGKAIRAADLNEVAEFESAGVVVRVTAAGVSVEGGEKVQQRPFTPEERPVFKDGVRISRADGTVAEQDLVLSSLDFVDVRAAESKSVMLEAPTGGSSASVQENFGEERRLGLTLRGRDGVLGGYTIGVPSSKAGEFFLGATAVSPALQGAGLGTVLHELVIAQARRAGYRTLRAQFAPEKGFKNRAHRTLIRLLGEPGRIELSPYEIGVPKLDVPVERLDVLDEAVRGKLNPKSAIASVLGVDFTPDLFEMIWSLDGRPSADAKKAAARLLAPHFGGKDVGGLMGFSAEIAVENYFPEITAALEEALERMGAEAQEPRKLSWWKRLLIPRVRVGADEWISYAEWFERRIGAYEALKGRRPGQVWDVLEAHPVLFNSINPAQLKIETGRGELSLYDLIAMNRSDFFRRDPPKFFEKLPGMLQALVEERLRAAADGKQIIHIGLVGAAFGQEPVSIAIEIDRVLERMARRDPRIREKVDFQVHVFDLPGAVYDRVKNNEIVYPEGRIRFGPNELPQEGPELEARTSRYFSAARGGFVRSSHLQERMKFHELNLLDVEGASTESILEQTGAGLDFMAVHNVLQYLTPGRASGRFEARIDAAADFLRRLVRANGTLSLYYSARMVDPYALRGFRGLSKTHQLLEWGQGDLLKLGERIGMGLEERYENLMQDLLAEGAADDLTLEDALRKAGIAPQERLQLVDQIRARINATVGESERVRQTPLVNLVAELRARNSLLADISYFGNAVFSSFITPLLLGAWRAATAVLPEGVKDVLRRNLPEAELEKALRNMFLLRGSFNVARRVLRAAGASVTSSGADAEYRGDVAAAVRIANRMTGTKLELSDVQIVRGAPGRADRLLLTVPDARGRSKVLVSPEVLRDFRARAAEEGLSFEFFLARMLAHESLAARGETDRRINALGFRDGGLRTEEELSRFFGAPELASSRLGGETRLLAAVVLGGRARAALRFSADGRLLARDALQRRDERQALRRALDEAFGGLRAGDGLAPEALSALVEKGDHSALGASKAAKLETAERALGRLLKDGPAERGDAEWLDAVGALMAAYYSLGGDIARRLGYAEDSGTTELEIFALTAGHFTAERVARDEGRRVDDLLSALFFWNLAWNRHMERVQPFRPDAPLRTTADVKGNETLLQVVQGSARMVAGADDMAGAEFTGHDKLRSFAAQYAERPDLFGRNNPLVLAIKDMDGKTEADVLAALGRQFGPAIGRAHRAGAFRVVVGDAAAKFLSADGKFEAEKLLSLTGVPASSMDIFALSAEDWNVPAHLREMVTLLVMLAGNIVQDATKQIDEDIERIAFVNIQA